MNLKFENIRSIEAELSGRLLRRGYSTLCSHFVDFLGTIHVTLRVCRRHPSALHILQSSYNGCYTKPIIPFKTTFNFNLRFWLLLYNKYAHVVVYNIIFRISSLDYPLRLCGSMPLREFVNFKIIFNYSSL